MKLFGTSLKTLESSPLTTKEIALLLKKVQHSFKYFEMMNQSNTTKFIPTLIYKKSDDMLKDMNKVVYDSINDQEAIDAFFELSRLEGIIPALESAHAVAYALKLAKKFPKQSILVNLSGRGDKDLDYVVDTFGIPK